MLDEENGCAWVVTFLKEGRKGGIFQVEKKVWEAVTGSSLSSSCLPFHALRFLVIQSPGYFTFSQ